MSNEMWGFYVKLYGNDRDVDPVCFKGTVTYSSGLAVIRTTKKISFSTAVVPPGFCVSVECK